MKVSPNILGVLRCPGTFPRDISCNGLDFMSCYLSRRYFATGH